MSDAIRVQPPLQVVGIGASAGGLEALERFFDNLPERVGMAFVIIQHLSPDFKSLMDELLARHTRLPIHLVEDGMLVETDHVYLIPPKKEMIISGGRLLLSERDRQQELTLPIDVFFRSLAQDCGARAVAVVLSGGGSDGSRGIRDIHEAGGLVVVQDIESAQFDGMPRTARDTNVAHFVLAPEDMPRVLLEHAAHRASQPAPIALGTPPEPGGMRAVYRMLEEEYGLDFTHYKPSTITRRIERRLALAEMSDLDGYVRQLKGERAELDALYRDLLIGVTRFFRDVQAFELLERRVLPELLQRTPLDAPVRLWVAGCATGEEAYSLAILLHELMAKTGERTVKIFATDVHRGSIERATRGLYDEEAVANVSPERLEKYFIRVGAMYQVVPEIRQTVVFAAHNVIKDPPFTRVDLITCRNLLIYLQNQAQQKVLSLFHLALHRGGMLFLGPSESVGPLAHDFESVDKHWRLYRKHNDARMPVDTRLPLSFTPEPRAFGTPTQAIPTRIAPSLLLGTYDALLDEVMPPSLLVSESGDLVHAFHGASRFLKLRDGRSGLDVLEMVDPALRRVLAGGLRRALAEPTTIVFKGVRLEESSGEAYKVSVRCVRPQHGGARHLLITLESLQGEALAAARPETEVDLGQVPQEQLRELEAELARTKESLQAAIEELQASNEELQASNEELQASNEELQSTNEELQSVNEELYTVNAEYQRKIGELTELTNDMDNLLSSTEVGTIFLDGQLRIRKYTPQIAEVFSLVPHDIGRSIETFANRMEHPGLVGDLKRVLATGVSVERELRDARGKAVFMRLLPYRVKGAAYGVVLTLIDVSGLKAAEDALFHERYLFNSLLYGVRDAIYVKDARGRFICANPPMAERLGLTNPREVVGRTVFEMPHPEALGMQKQDDAALRTGEAQHEQLERRAQPDGSEAWDMVTRLLLRDPDERIVGLIAIFRSVTEQKRAEEKIQDAVRLRDQFLAMLSHELRNPLAAIVSAASLLPADTSGDAHPPLDVLRRQAQQMERLLDDLLEAGRVTQNKIELHRGVVDLCAVARDAVDAVRGLIAPRALDLSTDIAAEPLCVDGDPVRLQQIQVNLLNNAIKYTQPGGRVTLSLRREGSEAVIRVRDNGAGIPRDMMDSVFEPFVQSKRTLDRSAGGLGLGLTLVRAFVEMHGGTVTARSDGEGQGSEFIVRLPSVSGVAVQRVTVAAPRAQPTVKVRVVLVEDNDDSREMLEMLLTRAGYACQGARSGPEGLELIDESAPDIALLDVGLPGMDGFELARRVRQNPQHSHIHLVALTGYGSAADRAAALQAGFDEHLVKPVQSDALLQLLANMSQPEAMLDGMPALSLLRH